MPKAVFKIFLLFITLNLSLASEINWYSYEKGVKLAKEKNKLILIDIYAQWCHWCNVLKNTTYRDKEVITIIKKYYIPIKIDAEREIELNKKLNQGGLPTTVILTPDGKIVYGYARYIPPKKMVKILLKYAKASPEELNKYAKKLEEKKTRKIKRITKKLKNKKVNYRVINKTL